MKKMMHLLLMALAAPQGEELTVSAFVDCKYSIQGMAIDESAKVVVTLTDEGFVAGRKLDDPAHELWRNIEPSAEAIECSAGTLVVCLRLPLAAAYDVRTGQRLVILDGPQDRQVTGLVTAKRGRTAWVGSDDAVVEMSEGGKWRRLLMNNGGVLSLAADNKKELLAVGGKDGSVIIVNANDLSIKSSVQEGMAGQVTALKFLKGSVLAGAEDGTIAIFEVNTGKKRLSISPGVGAVRALMTEPKEKWFACAGANGTASICGAEDGTEFMRLRLEGGSSVKAMAYVPRERRIWFAAGSQIFVSPEIKWTKPK